MTKLINDLPKPANGLLDLINVVAALANVSQKSLNDLLAGTCVAAELTNVSPEGLNGAFVLVLVETHL